MTQPCQAPTPLHGDLYVQQYQELSPTLLIPAVLAVFLSVNGVEQQVYQNVQKLMYGHSMNQYKTSEVVQSTQ
jgi:hypothetical protein